MNNISLSILVAIGMIPSAGIADIDTPPIMILLSDNEASALEFNCEGKKPFNSLRCRIIQKSIRRQGSDFSEFEKLTSKYSVVQKAEAIETFVKQCNSEEFRTSAKRNFHPLAKGVVETEFRIIKESCDCAQKKKDFECLIGMQRNLAEIKKKTCSIGINDFEVEFRKISENKWMNAPAPHGICNVVNAMTLEKTGNYEWKYTQTRLAADNDSTLCKFQLNTPVVYKSDVADTLLLNCEYVNFGPAL